MTERVSFKDSKGKDIGHPPIDNPDAGIIETPISSIPDPAIAKENRIKTAAGAFGAFCMAQKLSDEEFLFAIMLSIVPVLAAYPRDLENRFNKALTKELKMHRKLLIQIQSENGANNKEQAYAKENTAQS